VRDGASFDAITLNVPRPVPQAGSNVPRFENMPLPMQKVRTVGSTGYSLYNAVYTQTPDKIYNLIMSYGVRGTAGKKDVDLPFNLWQGMKSC